MQASSTLMMTAKNSLQDGFKKARKLRNGFNEISSDKFERFRVARNRITHEGFSPKDDDESARLLIEVGFPLLLLCYRELHSFDLMDALIVELNEHLQIANRVYKLVRKDKNLHNIEIQYCFDSFAQCLRLQLKGNFLPDWEEDVLIKSENIGTKFGAMELILNKVSDLFGDYERFNCPVCQDVDSVLGSIDMDYLHLGDVLIQRMVCGSCGFTIGFGKPHLAMELLREQIDKVESKILKEYGINQT